MADIAGSESTVRDSLTSVGLHGFFRRQEGAWRVQRLSLKTGR